MIAKIIKEINTKKFQQDYINVLNDIFHISLQSPMVFPTNVDEFIAYLKKRDEISGKRINFMEQRAKKRVQEIKSICDITKFSQYLDIGCNNGKLTSAISQLLTCENTFGVDIVEYKDCVLENFSLYKDVLPFEDNSMDLITCFQVLHHCETPETLLKEIKRVLKPSGHFILREHDAYEDMKTLINFEHLLHEIFSSECHGAFTGNYKTERKWDKIVDMKPLKRTEIKGPTRYYTKSYVK